MTTENSAGIVVVGKQVGTAVAGTGQVAVEEAVAEEGADTFVVEVEEAVILVVDKIDSGDNTTGYIVEQSPIGSHTVDNSSSFTPLSLSK